MITSPLWIIAGAILLILAIYALIQLWKGQGEEKDETPPYHPYRVLEEDDEPYNPEAFLVVKIPTCGENDHLYKLGDFFVALGYHTKFGLTFERYVEMVHNGTWRDLATR